MIEPVQHDLDPEAGPATVLVGAGAVGPGPSAEGYPRAAFRSLPEPVDPVDMVAVSDTDPPPDPTMSRDSDHEYMLRYI